MTDNLWTKGPWHIGQRRKYRIGIDADGWTDFAKVVVAIETFDSRDEIIPRDMAEGIANAHLIAAAPSLYDALVEAAEFIQPFNRAEELLDRIEAALKLARGEPA